MLIKNKEYRTIWLNNDRKSVNIIDQRFLPFEFVIENIKSTEEMAVAIKDMHLRGAPLIGAAAGYGMYLAVLEAQAKDNIDEYLKNASKILEATRPTAVNLKWALDRMMTKISDIKDREQKIEAALNEAEQIADEDVDICKNIGLNGVKIIEEISKRKKGKPVNILTHCNAGALATVDHGTATSSIYEASRRNIPVHIWVEETRPRNQGKLTSWEMLQNNIPHTVICDNTGGHVMQHGLVDLVIVGTDRTTSNGDVANKIGTYLKALAAADNGVPFYVALPSSTIDWSLNNGLKEIPIEERDQEEVLYIEGKMNSKIEKVQLFADDAEAKNFGFDVTPARLVTGFITEKGICKPNELNKFFNKYFI